MALSGAALSASSSAFCALVKAGGLLGSILYLTDFLLIALPFLAVGAPVRNDAYRFAAVFFTVVVRNQQQCQVIDPAKGLPAVFAVLDAILLCEGKGIREHAHRSLEAHAMLL